MAHIYAILRNFAPFITLPIAIVVGAVGYNIEKLIGNKKTPMIESVEERRRKRQTEKGEVLISPDPVDPKAIVPKTILDRNLPPSLMPESDQ